MAHRAHPLTTSRLGALRLTVLAGLFAAVLLPPSLARAHAADEVHAHGAGELGLRVLDGAPLLFLRPGLILESGRLSIALAPPLSIHLGPVPSGTSRLRPEDWDAPSDFGRILSELTWSSRSGSAFIEAGARTLPGLGHGTLVDDYAAFLDPDHARTALSAGAAGGAWRVDLLTGDLLSPHVVAGRLQLSPLDLGEAHPTGGWHLGLTAAADLSAPIALTGVVERTRTLLADTAVVTWVAGDTDVVLHRGEAFALAAFADTVLVAGGPNHGTAGLHLGLLADVGPPDGVTAALRLEARRLGRGYQPEAIDAWYTLERWAWPLGAGVPKAVADTPETWGARAEVSVRLDEYGEVGVELDVRQLGPGNLAFHFAAESMGPVDLWLHLAHRGFPGWQGLLDGGRWLGLGEVRVDLHPQVYLVARAGRVFRVDPGLAAHAPSWDVGGGVGGSF